MNRPVWTRQKLPWAASPLPHRWWVRPVPGGRAWPRSNVPSIHGLEASWVLIRGVCQSPQLVGYGLPRLPLFLTYPYTRCFALSLNTAPNGAPGGTEQKGSRSQSTPPEKSLIWNTQPAETSTRFSFPSLPRSFFKHHYSFNYFFFVFVFKCHNTCFQRKKNNP